MTIADFWGIENVVPEINDGRGTSLVIARTEKGEKLFEDIKNELKWKEVGYEEGVRNNPCEHTSTSRPQQRDMFFEDFYKMSFPELEKKYAADVKVSFSKKVISLAKNTVKAILQVIGVRKKSSSDYGMLLIFKK